MTEAAPRPDAPGFPEGLDWLNVERPLSLADLRGKIVVLDFWASCCINCMHVLSDLKRLENKYGAELAVVSVHSAKYAAERATGTVRRAVLRNGIGHPVVNDRDLALWSLYGIPAWPTLVLIDPLGKVVGALSGEAIFETFDRLIGEILAALDPQGLIDRRPLPMRREAPSDSSFLSFPGKVLADPQAPRLFIADSGHHRIVVHDLSGKAPDAVIGSGEAGFQDGPFAEARFRNPQGMALDGEVLYVADADNHAIRKVDLAGKTVSTAAGTGRQARMFNISGPGGRTPLNSPWDLAVCGGFLFIAMAGAHQIWKMDLAKSYVSPHAGAVEEGRKDGPLPEALFAQPSGIATDGKKIYAADSESSSIRSVDPDPAGTVSTLAGGDLFDFGDTDGKGSAARFQHPLGIAELDGVLFIADTYNSRIRRLALAEGTVATLCGASAAGFRDGADPLFDEPAGLSAAAGRLYVADRNNAAVRVVDLKTNLTTTLKIGAISPP